MPRLAPAIITNFVVDKYESWPISNENQCIKPKFFHSLYVSKKHIFYKHCCGCDFIVINDVIDHHIETIHSISSNSTESYTVMQSEQHKSKISDVKTDDS